MISRAGSTQKILPLGRVWKLECDSLSKKKISLRILLRHNRKGMTAALFGTGTDSCCYGSACGPAKLDS